MQRSYEGTDFATVGMVYAKGTAKNQTEYYYIEKNIFPKENCYKTFKIETFPKDVT